MVYCIFLLIQQGISVKMNVDPAEGASDEEDEEDEFHYDMEEDGHRYWLLTLAHSLFFCVAFPKLNGNFSLLQESCCPLKRPTFTCKD